MAIYYKGDVYSHTLLETIESIRKFGGIGYKDKWIPESEIDGVVIFEDGFGAAILKNTKHRTQGINILGLDLEGKIYVAYGTTHTYYGELTEEYVKRHNNEKYNGGHPTKISKYIKLGGNIIREVFCGEREGAYNEYDENYNTIHMKSPSEFETWKEYNENNKLIHYKDSDGTEIWYEYDENNNLIGKKIIK